MVTKDMRTWKTGICRVVSTDETEEVVVRGHALSELIGSITFAERMFLLLQGTLPTKPQARVLDALLVASAEHGIAPPSMAMAPGAVTPLTWARAAGSMTVSSAIVRPPSSTIVMPPTSVCAPVR